MALRVLLLLACLLSARVLAAEASAPALETPSATATPAATAVTPAAAAEVSPVPAPAVLGITPVPATVYSEVVIENPSARLVLSTQRASISRFELKGSHPIRLPKHLHRDDGAVGGAGDDGKPALTVLAPFIEADGPTALRLARNQHSLMTADGAHVLWGIPASSTAPWTVAARDGGSTTLTWDNGAGLDYAVTYRMHPTLPQVAVAVVVRNHGTAASTLYPQVSLVNGIHQDYAPNEAPYLIAFVHQGGAEMGELHKASFTDRQQVLSGATPLLPIAEAGKGVDFVGIKSRFFAVWWTPGTVALDGEAAARGDGPLPVVTADGGIPVPVQAAATAPAGPPWRADALGFQTDAHLDHQGQLTVAYGKVTVPAGRSATVTWSLTASGMTAKELAQFGPAEQRIELTDFMHRFFIIFTRPLVWVLDQIVKIVPSYAVAVILLTLLVKALLFRLTWAQHSSMFKMQKLAPELKYIQEQYKNDRTKLGQKTMEMYRKHGVNPVGGCLPLLVQIPIFIALYNAFQYNADMRGATFLWVSDLTLPDQVWGTPLAFLGNWVLSLNPLPLIYIAVTVWMSLTTPLPTGGDPQQEQLAKTFRWMPVLFGVIFYNMPSGLVLYFTVNAILSTLEVKFIRQRLAAGKSTGK